jgi:hypothetical protein
MSQNTVVAEALSGPEKTKLEMKKLRVSSGETMGEPTLPMAAQLVYLLNDQAVAQAATG